MAAERVRVGPSRTHPGRQPPAARLPPGPPSLGVPSTASGWLHLQQAYGNQAVQRLPVPTVQRTPLSEELAKLSAGKAPADVFTLVGQPRFKAAATTPAEQTAMTEVLKKALPDPNDRWVALKILGGRLGMSGSVSAKESGLKKDIPSQPIELSFVEGRSDARALVIAGVHGSERQGIDVARALIELLRTRQPHYGVIVVPSLFPQHAEPAWGEEGQRERDTFTNRNFPELTADIAGYKDGHPVDAAGNPLKAAKDEKGRERDILVENAMLMELIDRFHPSRMISIHGTHDNSAAGVFADPHFLSPAKEKAITLLAAFLSWFAGLFGASGPSVKALEAAFAKLDQARTKNDVDLALATAYAIAAKTKSTRELKGRFKNKKKQTTPSVAGNKLYLGAGKENATWREDLDPKTGLPKPWQDRAADKGTSLGLYAPARGISVFTVEPPVNRALSTYDGKAPEPGGNVVSRAERETEIKAYADAVATVLLGPDTGDDALRRQRPAAP